MHTLQTNGGASIPSPLATLLAMVTDKDVAVRRKAVNKIRNLRGHCTSSTKNEKLADVKQMMKGPYIDEELLIPTDYAVDEDADATEKSR